MLDNAAGTSQVAPLLPGDEGCLVLVTSRRHLGDLPGAVTPVLLDVLPPGRAARMFIRLAPQAAGSSAEVAEVVELAGFLPLAISLLARLFARHRSWTLADLAAETRASLLTLTAENGSIAAALEVSFRYLDPARRRMFCLLGLHPGASFEGYAAAALAGTSLQQAAGLLDGVHGEGLLTETGYRRYGMHDLLRRYACDHAADLPGSEQAVQRLLDYYQHTAALAQARMARYTRPGPRLAAPPGRLAVPDLQDAGQALAWARADRASLLACLDHADRAGQHTRVIALTGALAELLRRDGPWTDAITLHAAAAQAARHLGDRLSQANALTDLGNIRRLIPRRRRIAAIGAPVSSVLAFDLSGTNRIESFSGTSRERRRWTSLASSWPRRDESRCARTSQLGVTLRALARSSEGAAGRSGWSGPVGCAEGVPCTRMTA
ncbi:MAG TPA: hypothetical protein VGI74_15250 [Streptosporangiaceae bacterium]